MENPVEEMLREYDSWRDKLRFEPAIDSLVVRWKGSTLEPTTTDRVVVLGMGGSGIVGALLRDYLAGEVDVIVVNDYEPPSLRGVLHIAVSYSGNTEETIYAAERALEAGNPVIAVTTGGKLAHLGIPVVDIPRSLAPRLALPQMLKATAHLVALLTGRRIDVDVAEHGETREMDECESPVVLTTRHAEAMATRVKTEYNENAKELAWVELLPEAHHNFITAVEAQKPRCAVLIEPEWAGKKHRDRIDVTREILQEAGVPTLVYRLGRSIPQWLGYLREVGKSTVRRAARKGVNPLETRNIARVKKMMEEREAA